MKRLTKKQIKRIGEIWAAETLLAAEVGMTNEHLWQIGITPDEMGRVVQITHKIGRKYAAEMPLASLEKIVNHVRKTV